MLKRSLLRRYLQGKPGMTVPPVRVMGVAELPSLLP